MAQNTLLNRLGPSYWLTKGAGWLATVKTGWIKNLLIRQFMKVYRVDMTASVRSQPDQFSHFQDFFTRELKPAARPILGDASSIISPVDGTVAACGDYENNTLVQYKQTTTNLYNLCQSDRIGKRGQYAVIYLSPRDYHRVHSPVQTRLVATSRIGGARRSVNPRNHQNIDGLYEKNVRVNCHLQLPAGEMLMVMVGAMIVSSVQTQWDEQLPLHDDTSIKSIAPIDFEPGEEMARFCLGSTVILVVPEGIGELHSLEVEQSLKLGEEIGVVAS